MSALARFERYLDEARALLRREALARTAAGVVVVAVGVTVIGVGWLLSRGFPPGQVVLLRALLIVGVLATGAALWLPTFLRLRRDEGAAELERRLPAQSGRIDTLLDSLRRQRNGEPENPLIECLAADAESVATRTPLEDSLPQRLRLIPAGIAGAAFAALIGLAIFGPSTWSAGARHLWLGQSLPAPALAAARSLQVRPGNATVRRNQDLTVNATLQGVRAGEAKLHVRYADGEWEEAPMQSTTDGKFDLTLFALRDPAEYYVSAGGVKSEQYRLTLVDVPKITALRLQYDYPSWTGLPPRKQDDDGAIAAVAGTRVRIDVEADAPLDQPLLVIDEASQPLEANAGNLTVRKDGHYRIAARFGDELVALTEDFPITATPDEKPTVEVVRPGRDYQANAIEEVPVRLRAADDYRVERLALRYSVNGGAFQDVRVPAGVKEIDTAALLNLEELGQAQPAPKAGGPQGLVPGDLITYYAVARDHGQESQTDLFMVQVQPFDRRYAQGQGGGGGGGGGGGDDETGIAERQKEILLATFNLTRDAEKNGRDSERRADNARMLADLQKTLREQAATLVERTRARELAGADPSIRQFVQSLEEATKSMDPAAERLAKVELTQAIPNEQKALQHLLRAEAAFRDIQVARRDNGGGGGGGGQAGRDVAEMTELELDLEKNQYETESQLSAQNGGGQQQQDEALRKLKELARRQEQLARENARNPQQAEQSKWRQEQLRREAEQLRQQLEQLAKQQNGQQQNGQQQGGQQSGQQNGQRGSQSSQGSQGSASASAASEASRQLEQALSQMRGEQQQQQQQASNGARQPQQQRGQQGNQSPEEASRALNRAVERLERGKQEAMGEGFEGLAREARNLVEEQRSTEQQLGDAVRGFRARQQAQANQRERVASDVFGGLDINSAEKLADRKRDLQARLEALQSRMQQTARGNREAAPQATEKLKQAASELEETQTTARLARSALEIERGRTTQAASRDGIITESLESLERALSESASVASTEGRQRRGAGESASPDELLAELASLRRAVEDARQNAARNGVASNGQPGQSRDPQGQGAQPGEGEGQGQGESQSQGQGEGQGQGQGEGQGQPSSQQGGQQGGRPASGGMTAGGGGGSWTGGAWNGGAWGGNDRLGGLRGDPGLPPVDLGREARASSERLTDLRGRLERGQLSEADLKALQELSDRLRRAGGDPMSQEYRRMLALVDQVELAALRAGGDESSARITRGNARAEEPARYRDNIAEYYRRLGGR
ncbi:MAG: hypothetical protein ABW136_01065 [Steroidobacteraceae bacterium]